MTHSADAARLPGRMPATVWALGFVSLFMDISSEIAHSLLPLFLTSTLGASMVVVGLIDGVAEATASITKVFSGYVSDKIGRRKPLLLLGYGLAALTKPLFPLATSPLLVLGARFTDRIGKGLRGAPRDALVADLTRAEIRGRAYGLRQALDTVGAFLGPLLAIGLMALFAGDMRAVLWAAVAPAGLSVMLIVVAVKDGAGDVESRAPLRLRDIAGFGKPFWRIVAIGVVFTLARFSEAFLILKAHEAGLSLVLAPMALVAMNIVYALGAYPAGIVADAAPARRLLGLGLLILIAADIVLAFAPGVAGALVGAGLWGAHMATTQGLLAKLVAQSAPAARRATAFGLFNLAVGAAMLAASVTAGLLWDQFGSAAAFIAGAGFAAFAAVLVAAWNLEPKEPELTARKP